MPKSVAILQSNYVPWKGYFDIINSVDEFVLYDDVQYTKRDWRNRNLVKTRTGRQWLSIPVRHSGRSSQAIVNTEIANGSWRPKHWRTIEHNYCRAAHFSDFGRALERVYSDCTSSLLSEVNFEFISFICDWLHISTTLRHSCEFDLSGDKTERLVRICSTIGARRYLSGPSARAYLDERLFAAAGIDVVYVDYSNYPEYRQLFPPFEHAVSVIDLLLNEGRGSTRFMKSFG